MKKNKRVYVFDWDDNIIHMPTTIKMEKRVAEYEWDVVELSTKEYAKIRKNKSYRYPLGVADPYLNFSNNPQFIVDLTKALEKRDFGPSFAKFKECLMYGNDFAIITARGQSKHFILAGIIMLIGHTFYADELNMMISNVGDINEYLSRQEIVPVTSDEVDFSELSKSGAEKDGEINIELRKVLSLDRYIERKTTSNDEFELDGKFSIGFSDDDSKNIVTIKDFIEKALKPKYPQIHFVVYDTSNPENIVKRPI